MAKNKTEKKRLVQLLRNRGGRQAYETLRATDAELEAMGLKDGDYQEISPKDTPEPKQGEGGKAAEDKEPAKS